MVMDINEMPVKWCSVLLSDILNRDKRLEASVYDIEAKQCRELVINGKYGTVPLSGDDGITLSAYYPGRFKRIYCEAPYGVGFYLPSQMTEIYPRAEKRISRLTKCDMSELKLTSNTLLLTRSGTIGSVSYVSKTIEGLIFSDDVIRVKFKNDYDLGFVYIFLKTKAGSTVLQTNGYGSVITHLEPEHLRSIPIPNAPVSVKQQINELVVKSYQLRDESNELIDKATNLLIKELDLPSIEKLLEVSPSNSFSVKLSEMNMRVDASYHVPAVNTIIERLNEHAKEVTTLADERVTEKILLPGRFKRVYVDEGHGIVFFSGKDIMQLDPQEKKYLSFAQHDKRIKEDLIIHDNMILVTCSGSIGNVVLVPKHWDGWSMTHDIIRYIPKSDFRGFAYIWLNSPYGRYLLNSKAYGSVVQHIEIEHLKEIPIPLLKDYELQSKINSIALEANDKRYEAYKLEQRALQIMNDEVLYAE